MGRKKVAIIGCGALGSVLTSGVKELLAEDYIITGVMANHYEKAEAAAKKIGCKAFSSLEMLLEDKPDFVVEAAGGEAICNYGEKILLSGSNLVVLSAGALADKILYKQLQTAAQKSGCALYIPSGAIGGFDLMRTITAMEKPTVSINNYKAPSSLNGAPYLKGRMLSEDQAEQVFTGTASEAIMGFPKNVNVAVAAALATVGTDETNVNIHSNPDLKENIHCIQITNSSVRATIEIASSPDPANPKSSTITAWSVIALLRNLVQPIRFF